MAIAQKYLLPKEISWLSFNARVLQEATDPSVPIIQRVRYLGIFSNNLDEFFRVRVADVRRLAAFSDHQEKERAQKLLDRIHTSVMDLQQRFDQVYMDLLRDLRGHKIYLVNETQLSSAQSVFVREYFQKEIQPYLSPVLLIENTPMPPLDDDSIYFGVKVNLRDSAPRYAVVEIPSDRLERFVRIPDYKGRKVLIVIDNILRYCLADLFCGVLDIESTEAYTFKLTRDAELELGEGISQSLLDKVAQSLKRRKVAEPVRFIYDRGMPPDLLDVLTRKLGMGRYSNVTPGSRYHNSKDFMSFPNLGGRSLEFKPLGTVPLPDLEPVQGESLFSLLRQRDQLLYYPYHSFGYVVRLLKTAALDPKVREIKISLYRVAKNSQIVNALITAARNRKNVTAVVELQARFDEANNISWSQRLTEAGVNVIFGVPGLKVHAKLIVISRQEGSVLKYYTHVGTGNFNEKTSNLYTDFSLLTYNQAIGHDAMQVFEVIQFPYRRYRYQELLVSPHTFRPALERAIMRETRLAQAGKGGDILIKCNNLVDARLIEKLYKASQAGVRIRLIVRGMCALVAGVRGISENIQIISIVDRYLEHARVYRFGNNGKPVHLISSADLMTRNLDHRVEVTVPILDPHLQQRLDDILEIQWTDNVKARVIDAKQTNLTRHGGGGRRTRSQEAIHRYLARCAAQEGTSS